MSPKYHTGCESRPTYDYIATSIVQLRNYIKDKLIEKKFPVKTGGKLCKLISSLPSTRNEARVKEQLLETFRETPNPEENELAKFSTVIKEHESLMTAREFKGVVGRTVLRVQDEPPKLQGKPHFLCGKPHKKGQCTQQM